MTFNKQSSVQNLLACFFDQSEAAFRFLTQNLDLRMMQGMLQYRNGRRVILPYKGGTPEPDFCAVTCLEREALCLKLLYGHGDFGLETYVTFNHVDRFMISEYLEAGKSPDARMRHHYWLQSEGLLSSTISLIAESLKDNIMHITEADQKTIDRARTMRSKRMRQLIYNQYKKDLKEVSARAAKAFIDKNYRQVIEYLMPYEQDLPKADLKKYEIAKKMLGIVHA